MKNNKNLEITVAISTLFKMTGSGNEGKTCKLIVCVVSENVVEEERDAFECVHITIASIYL